MIYALTEKKWAVIQNLPGGSLVMVFGPQTYSVSSVRPVNLNFKILSTYFLIDALCLGYDFSGAREQKQSLV